MSTFCGGEGGGGVGSALTQGETGVMIWLLPVIGPKVSFRAISTRLRVNARKTAT